MSDRTATMTEDSVPVLEETQRLAQRALGDLHRAEDELRSVIDPESEQGAELLAELHHAGASLGTLIARLEVELPALPANDAAESSLGTLGPISVPC